MFDQEMRPIKLSSVNQFADRMRLVQKWRGISARQWATDAGLSVNAINSFYKRAGEDPEARIHGDTLFAVARAASVDAEWLYTGQGDPDRIPGVRGQTAKEIVAAIAAADGVDPAILDQYRAIKGHHNASGMYWMGILMALANERSGRKAAKDAHG